MFFACSTTPEGYAALRLHTALPFDSSLEEEFLHFWRSFVVIWRRELATWKEIKALFWNLAILLAYCIPRGNSIRNWFAFLQASGKRR